MVIDKISEKNFEEMDANTEGFAYLKEKLALESEELRERFLFVIEMWAADKYRYNWLEKRSGIAAARWQNVLLDKQFPTLEMLLVVCKHQPQFTYWLMLGREWKIRDQDPLHGLNLCLDYPTEDVLNRFRAHREWIKQKRKSKK